MKTITVHVSEEKYAAFKSHASETGTSAAELIREAMDEYHRKHIARGGSIFGGDPADAGEALRPFSRDDDLLDELLG